MNNRLNRTLLAAALAVSSLLSNAFSVKAEDSGYEQAVKAAQESYEKMTALQKQLDEGSVGFFKASGDTTAASIITDSIRNAKNQGLTYGVTKIGAAGDATSLDNMVKSMDFLAEGNAYRRKEGGTDLLVTDRMMALAQADTNYSTEMYTHWFSHLSTYSAGENYAYWWDDPYDFWYVEEKQNAENGSGETGHFENIRRESYIVTGFGINSATDYTHYVQTFGGQWCMQRLSGGYGKTYTVAEYKKRLNDYIVSTKNDYNAAKKAYEEAVAAVQKYEQGGFSLGAGKAVYGEVGGSLNLSLTIGSATENYSKWTSSASNIASVDAYGNVTCRRAGVTTIKASSPTGNSASTTLRVLFTDVPASGYYYCNPVYWAADQGITSGFTDEDGFARCFGPERSCTRAQMVTFLWRLAGKPNPQKTSSEFTDLQDSSLYYYKAVLWATENGITYGYDDGTFRPDETCLREHVVTFLYRFADKPSVNTGENPFNDITAEDYYYNAALWANANGIAKGYSEGEYAGGFGPKLDCLREHIVTFMYRYAG
jgi:hypothetical protein